MVALSNTGNGPSPPVINSHQSRWLALAEKVQAIAQAGLANTSNLYSVERYNHLQALAAEMLACIEDGDGGGPGFVPNAFVMPAGVATPKVDVRAACFKDGKLLMVNESVDGTWALPGGWADVGDIPARAAERETLEESGYDCVAHKLIGVFDVNRHPQQMTASHAYKFIFLCDLTGKQVSAGHETIDTKFFGRDEMPSLEGTQRTTPFQFKECFAHLDDSARPTWFD